MINIYNVKKIDLSFSIKLREINFYVCEEYKTEREARDENVPAKGADFVVVDILEVKITDEDFDQRRKFESM